MTPGDDRPERPTLYSLVIVVVPCQIAWGVGGRGQSQPKYNPESLNCNYGYNRIECNHSYNISVLDDSEETEL
jgi:hypothetical protein